MTTEDRNGAIVIDQHHERLVKLVKQQGSSGRIYMPKSWIGAKVLCIKVQEP
jgi:putative transposon-encoded protein